MGAAARAALPSAAGDVAAAKLTPAILGIGLVVAVLSSALPYTLEMYALRRLPSRTFGILMSLEPVVAALVGFLLLGERLDVGQWIAVVCVCVASAGATRTAREAPPPIEV